MRIEDSEPESTSSDDEEESPYRKELWRPRFLITVINANDRISRVKPVKPRSTWVITQQPRQWTPMNPLTEPTHTRSQSLVKDTVKTGLTVDVSECRPELEASPHQRWLNVTQIPVPGGW
jgi:hypothetical protein